MLRAGTFSILVVLSMVAHGAAQTIPHGLTFQETGFRTGSSVATQASFPRISDSFEVYVLLGVNEGATPVTVGSQSVILPITGPLMLVGSGFGRGGARWSGAVTVPNEPALVGLQLRACAVIMTASGIQYISASVPFGPIIEDSVN